MRFVEMADELEEDILERHKTFLEERIDPDSGLLDFLLAKHTMSQREFREIRAKGPYHNRNAALLDLIIDKQQRNGLVKALKDTEQLHLVNYLNADGQYRSEFKDDWPLMDKETSILNVNHKDLVDLIEPGDLVGRLFSRRVINRRQKEAISAEKTCHERNEVFLEILNRRSVRDFKNTILCLNDSNQRHIAEILDKGGVVAKIDAGGLDDKTEDEIIAILMNKTPEERQRILEAVGLNVIGAKKGESIVVYVYCQKMNQLIQLKEMQDKDTLKTAVQSLFMKLLTFVQSVEVRVKNPQVPIQSMPSLQLCHSRVDGMTVTLSEDEYERCRSYFPEDITLRGVCDLNPEEMSHIQKVELKDILQSAESSLKAGIKLRAVFDFDPEQMSKQQQYELRNILQSMVIGLKDKGHTHVESQVNANEGQKEEISHLNVAAEKPKLGDDMPDDDQSGETRWMRKVEYASEELLIPHKMALSFKKGDLMETIPSADIGDTTTWWRAIHLKIREVGYVPRRLVVIDYQMHLKNDTSVATCQREYFQSASSNTSMSHLPLELLDSILQKSYLQHVLTKKQFLKNKDYIAINQLASVDCCWSQRLRRRKFKKKLYCSLIALYRRIEKKASVYKINRQYLEENIHLQGLVIRLKSNDCLTDVERASLYEQNLPLDKKNSFKRFRDPISEIVKRTEAIHSVFRRCLCDTKQHSLAEVIENGGAMTKVEIKLQNAKTSVITVHQNVQVVERSKEFRDKTKIPRSHQIVELIDKLKEDDLEILSAGQDEDVIIVWTRCKTKHDLEKLQTLIKSRHIIEFFTELVKNVSFSSDERNSAIIKPKVNIDFEQFEKTIVFFSIFAKFTSRLDLRRTENEYVRGVTKLRNKIHVLLNCCSSAPLCVILVFEYQIPFRFQKRIEIKEIEFPRDIAPIEMEISLYVLDLFGYVWKIKEGNEKDKKEKIIKWLELRDYSDDVPQSLSVTRDGQLLLFGRRKDDRLWSLMIFGGSEKAGLRHFIPLPEDIQLPFHAVETSKGNFIICHEIINEKKEEESESAGGRREMEEKFMVVSELSGDGKTILRRFIPKNEEQILNFTYLAVDSFGRVFLTDYGNDRIILLDSYLQLNGILIPTEEDGKVGRKILRPWRLFYDEETNELIVVGIKEVFVYTLNRK